MMHKISCRIIEWCIAHRVGVLVIGTNRFWKQNADMGKRNNQNFVSIPHAELRQMIAYKAIGGERYLPNLISQQTILSLFMDTLKGNHRFLAGESAEDGIRLIAV